MIGGVATRAGTERYAALQGAACAPGHYSDFLNLHLKLSSLGVGTFPGEANDATDAALAEIVERAVLNGINVIDTAAHYRYGRALRAVGEGLARAFAAGVAREAVCVAVKGGFLTQPDGPPADFGAWFGREIAAAGLGTADALAGRHLLTPAHIAAQLAQARDALGLDTLDLFLVDQPEVQVAARGKEAMHRALEAVFVQLERAVDAGEIAGYGISSFAALRVETDAPEFQSLAALLGMAGRAAQALRGAQAKHHLRAVQLPFNPAMTEGFTRFSQATGMGNVASPVQAAHQLRLYTMASHTLGKGAFAREDPLAALPGLANPAQRALQFARSTPGVGTALAGLSTPAHLDDLLAVARTPPLAKAAYTMLYRRTE